MIVDCHAHLEPRMLDVGRLLAKLDAAGIDRVAMIPAMNDPLPPTPTRLLAVMRRMMRSGAGRLAAEAVHRALLTPEGDLRLGELERWRSVPGMIGVKLHPHWHDYRTEILSALLGRDDLWAYRGAYPNLHVDLSSPHIDEALARDAVRAMGPERCLYGTDAPYGAHEADGSYDYGEIKRWIERMPVRSRDQEGILGGNFQALLASRGA